MMNKEVSDNNHNSDSSTLQQIPQTSEHEEVTSEIEIDLTDLTSPHTWYQNARKKIRNVIIHAGPTNSGKTYQGLKQLQTSSSGIYCGPLRLLAWEVAEKLNNENVPCDLITGVERKEVKNARHKAVTVEMADVGGSYDCAVIDEIQMLSCESRGDSFTRALLGLSVNELHLCGDPASIPLIMEILKVTGDNVKVEHYERLSPLVPLSTPLGSLYNIRAGDCIVVFSKKEIFRIKREIEALGKHLCCVVYGSLPPATRTRQATMFNDDDSKYDVLVATDAIGMGLNLNISRIIFSRLEKYDGTMMRDLSISEIKQIAGRAGRYGSKYPAGEVTCLYERDLSSLHSALESPSPILRKAGLFPCYALLSMYSYQHPEKGIYEILSHFIENAKLSENYFISNCGNILKIAEVVDELPLSLHDKYIFCLSPVNMDNISLANALEEFADSYSKKCISRLRKVNRQQCPLTLFELANLESDHKILELYVWLNNQFEDIFPDINVAYSSKSYLNGLFETYLERLKLEPELID